MLKFDNVSINLMFPFLLRPLFFKLSEVFTFPFPVVFADKDSQTQM